MRRWWYRAAVIGALLLGLAPLAYSQKSEVEPAPVGEYRGKVTASRGPGRQGRDQARRRRSPAFAGPGW